MVRFAIRNSAQIRIQDAPHDHNYSEKRLQTNWEVEYLKKVFFFLFWTAERFNENDFFDCGYYLLNASETVF
jgi:hypothetical protein